MTVSKMMFHPKINDHEKEITCRAENTEILNSAIDDNKLLNVHCKTFRHKSIEQKYRLFVNQEIAKERLFEPLKSV